MVSHHRNRTDTDVFTHHHQHHQPFTFLDEQNGLRVATYAQLFSATASIVNLSATFFQLPVHHFIDIILSTYTHLPTSKTPCLRPCVLSSYAHPSPPAVILDLCFWFSVLVLLLRSTNTHQTNEQTKANITTYNTKTDVAMADFFMEPVVFTTAIRLRLGMVIREETKEWSLRCGLCQQHDVDPYGHS